MVFGMLYIGSSLAGEAFVQVFRQSILGAVPLVILAIVEHDFPRILYNVQ